jgi:hypothetical protein
VEISGNTTRLIAAVRLTVIEVRQTDLVVLREVTRYRIVNGLRNATLVAKAAILEANGVASVTEEESVIAAASATIAVA